MSEILMTNIFFTITAIASVVLTIVLVIVLIYVIKLVKKINGIADVVGDETVKIVSDIDDVRDSVREHVSVIKGVASAAFMKKMIETIFTKSNKKK